MRSVLKGLLGGFGSLRVWNGFLGHLQGLGKLVVSGVWLGVMGAWSLRILG